VRAEARLRDQMVWVIVSVVVEASFRVWHSVERDLARAERKILLVVGQLE
jgi:hypothetical protein